MESLTQHDHLQDKPKIPILQAFVKGDVGELHGAAEVKFASYDVSNLPGGPVHRPVHRPHQ